MKPPYDWSEPGSIHLTPEEIESRQTFLLNSGVTRMPVKWRPDWPMMIFWGGYFLVAVGVIGIAVWWLS